MCVCVLGGGGGFVGHSNVTVPFQRFQCEKPRKIVTQMTWVKQWGTH